MTARPGLPPHRLQKADDVAVFDLDALGSAGRSGRIDHIGEVVRLDSHRRRRRRLLLKQRVGFVQQHGRHCDAVENRQQGWLVVMTQEISASSRM